MEGVIYDGTEIGSEGQILPRARGRVRVSVHHDGKQSRLDGLWQSGSLSTVFPRVCDSSMTAILLNTAGGITDGDHFEVDACAAQDACLTLTTQAAERAYRAASEMHGLLSTRIEVRPRARINWLPQETILFNGCALRRRLTAEISPGATFLAVEPLVFGRAASGEVLSKGHFSDRIELTRDGMPIYFDRFSLCGDIAAHLAKPFCAGGAGAMASLVFASDAAEAALEPLRSAMPEQGGVSMIRPDLLAARILAEDSFALRRTLIPVISRLTDNDIPKPWLT